MEGEGDSLTAEVKAVIDSLDPEGLLSLGVPNDEYLFEARELAQRIRRGEVMAGDRIQQYWVQRFCAECGLVRSGLAQTLAERLAQLRP